MKRNSVLMLVGTCLIAATVVALDLGSTSQAEDTAKKTPPRKSSVLHAFMEVKLGQAQAILEGLTIEDFDQIEKNATALFLLTKAEEWKASKDPQYVSHSDEFARVASKLAKYAKDKNLDGATLTYLQLTLNCVECHRFVRDKAAQK